MKKGQHHDVMDRIAKVRKQVREFRAFKDEELLQEVTGERLRGLGDVAGEEGAIEGGGNRFNMKRLYNEPLMLLPESTGASGRKLPAGLVDLPTWPTALRASLSSNSLGLDFLSANGTLWKLVKRPEPSGVSLSSLRGICAALALAEEGNPKMYVTSTLTLTESVDDAATFIVIYCDPALYRNPPPARALRGSSEIKVGVVLASTFAGVLREDSTDKIGTKGVGVKGQSHSNLLVEVMRALMNGQWSSVRASLEGMKFLSAKLSSTAGSEGEAGEDAAVKFMSVTEAFGSEDTQTCCFWTIALEKDDPIKSDQELNNIFSQLQA